MACPEFANVGEVAERLGVSVSFLTKWRLYDPKHLLHCKLIRATCNDDRLPDAAA
jgi:DNA-binding transcriptional MerR regulator